MIKVRLLKSLMENEEGMNHLWIQLSQVTHLTNPRIDIELPPGVFRLPNLNGCPENEAGSIAWEGVSGEANLFVEIYTEEAIPCGEKTISVTLNYLDEEKKGKVMVISLSFQIVDEHNMDNLEIDENFLARLKELLNTEKKLKSDNEENFLLIKPKVIEAENSFSYLEKKYRIDF